MDNNYDIFLKTYLVQNNLKIKKLFSNKISIQRKNKIGFKFILINIMNTFIKY
jgi:hypothetical protein